MKLIDYGAAPAVGATAAAATAVAVAAAVAVVTADAAATSAGAVAAVAAVGAAAVVVAADGVAADSIDCFITKLGRSHFSAEPDGLLVLRASIYARLLCVWRSVGGCGRYTGHVDVCASCHRPVLQPSRG